MRRRPRRARGDRTRPRHLPSLQRSAAVSCRRPCLASDRHVLTRATDRSLDNGEGGGAGLYSMSQTRVGQWSCQRPRGLAFQSPDVNVTLIENDQAGREDHCGWSATARPLCFLAGRSSQTAPGRCELHPQRAVASNPAVSANRCAS
jgi:hypothetical protein